MDHQRTITRGPAGRFERIDVHVPYITVRTNTLTPQQLDQRATGGDEQPRRDDAAVEASVSPTR